MKVLLRKIKLTPLLRSDITYLKAYERLIQGYLNDQRKRLLTKKILSVTASERQSVVKL